MANVQTQFNQFDDNIRLKRFEENAILREKRDIVLRVLKENLPGVFAKYGEKCPVYYTLDQGSYEMFTGIKPLDGDYDIDQGIYFIVSIKDYPDPVLLKKRVHEALKDHTKRVEIRQSCVTVFYEEDGEPVYHVDLAIFSDASKNSDKKAYMAKGKANSTPAKRIWQASDPQALSDTLFDRFQGEGRTQFRRVIRYLKRWKCVNFSGEGHSAPSGIGLTVSAYKYMQATYRDAITMEPDDLGALRKLVTSMLNGFTETWDSEQQKAVRRLAVYLPVEPYNDLFARMTDKQMEQFEDELKILQKALNEAHETADPVEACKTLRKVFGDDFPVPTKESTAKIHVPAIVSSSSSA